MLLHLARDVQVTPVEVQQALVDNALDFCGCTALLADGRLLAN